MKKFIVLGIVGALIVAIVFLWHRSGHSSDAKLDSRIFGTWTNAGGYSMTISQGGSFSSSMSHDNWQVIFQGLWLAKGTELEMTVTNAQSTRQGASVPRVTLPNLRVIHVDDHQLIYQAGGQKLTLNR